ncbi:T9SS type A sorting domain-containing protein [Hymenobacter sp. DH14]|uniref:T9SS type A sorting domain-containing protein n=1 Tax=Hymenobacter cyanobacteriorum TaxID=2926463 RepID=A0A9X1VHY9_9BACT|nr:T9SS type A sorting domain-containing protein [Hymenobacter cyanobacteriorum]MCI1189013.1 T9SS type A sorting domain-containing protein [Hymenobacter cyanobacteriorum]
MKKLISLGWLVAVAALTPARAQDLLNNGATISLTGGATLSVSGSLQNSSGTLDLSSGPNEVYVGGNLLNDAGATLLPGTASTVTLNGTAAQQLSLNGAQLFNLTVNKPSGGVGLPANSNADIAGALTLSGGMVTTDPSATLRLLNGATLSGEQSGRYVKGNLAAVKANVPGGATTAFPNSFTLTPTATTTSLTVTRRAGLTTAQVSFGTSVGGNRGIDRIWSASAAVKGAVQLNWLPDDDNGLSNFSVAQVWGRTAAPMAGSGWARISPAQNAGSARTVVGTAPASGLSFFTVSTASSPLPVTLIDFSVRREGPAARLNWRTAQELNNDYFVVEASADGQTYRPVGSPVPGQGTVSAPIDYTFTDPNLLNYRTDLVYYRLRQVDTDGTASYSPVRTIALTAAATGLALFPNPASTGAMLTGTRPGTVVQVFDALGRVVITATADATGTAALALPVGLATGVYVVRADDKALRLTVE